MVVNCKTFAEGKMKKQPTIGHYEYHSMFHIGETEYDVYSVYHDRDVPELGETISGVGRVGRPAVGQTDGVAVFGKEILSASALLEFGVKDVPLGTVLVGFKAGEP